MASYNITSTAPGSSMLLAASLLLLEVFLSVVSLESAAWAACAVGYEYVESAREAARVLILVAESVYSSESEVLAQG